MGDVTGWELGATYTTRSHPQLQDTVLSAVTPQVEWSDRWGRHVPDWRGEQVTVSRRDLSHTCGNPGCTDRVVSHSTPHDPAKWGRVDPADRYGAKVVTEVNPDIDSWLGLDVAAWPSVRTVPGDGAP